MKYTPSKSSVIIALATIYIAWGSTYLAIRYAVETMPPFLMAASRFFVAGPLLYFWLRFRGEPKPERAHWRSAFVIGGLLLVGGNGCVVWAEQTVPSGLTALLVSVSPLWMALFNWLRPKGERPSWQTGTGLILGFIGLIVLIGPENISLANGSSLALIALIVAPITWALGSVYSKNAPLPPSPFMATATQMMAGGLLLLICGLAMGEASQFHISAFSEKSWWSLLYLIIGGSLAGFTSYVWLLQNVPLALASTYAYVNPFVAVLLGVVVAGETLAGNTITGGIIILISVAIITKSSK